MVTYTLFYFFRLTICIPFLIRKMSTFYQTVFKKMYTIDNMFGSKSQTLFWYNGILYIHETNRPSLFSVLLQL